MVKTAQHGDQKGQAVVEYLLMLITVVGLVGILGIGFRRSLKGLWGKLARDISAPCPGCQPPRDVRFR